MNKKENAFDNLFPHLKRSKLFRYNFPQPVLSFQFYYEAS